MKQAVKRGVGFGITSGIITTLGILVGLYSSTNSKIIVFGGILFIVIADAFSDALGIHMSEESSTKRGHQLVWKSTFATFFSKLIVAGFFIVPILVFKLNIAVIVSIFLGLLVLSLFSYKIAIYRKENPFKTILQHVMIAIFVVIITYLVGKFVGNL